MLGKLARAITVLFFVTMVAVYALSVGRSEPAPQQNPPRADFMFT